MIYQGTADVTLTTPTGEFSEMREVIVDAPESTPAGTAEGLHVRTGALKITVEGPAMKGAHEAMQVEVVMNAGSFAIDLSAQRISISRDSTQFST